MVSLFTGNRIGTGLSVAIVVSRFNDFITERLLSGAVQSLQSAGLAEDAITIAWVPGAMELALAAKKLAESGHYQAVIALGCVIQGSTDHYDYVCSETAKGLASVGLNSGIPVIFGVLTTQTIEQAIERAGTKAGNKGVDAAQAAVEMANLIKQL